ncbi:MAG: zinc ribbon domain-containing protein [Chloroflexi bacterium]|nr:zinc ribbon domain-containing protein [Chloroflexota bacterium]
MTDTKFFHGDIQPKDFAQALIAEFDQGNLRAQQVGQGDEIVVQIATRQRRRSGGQTALTVTLERVKDGVAVQVGKQSWGGLAASLGVTALYALRNPFSLLGRLDDVAQDIESLRIADRVWEVIEDAAYASGASFELSERLRRLVCEHCNTANPLGEPSCIACGAPLGGVQPQTCPQCGFVVKSGESVCPNCGQRL